MSNPYKKMFVLPEEEYLRLKQKMSAAVIQPETVVVQSPEVLPIHFACKICGKKYKQKRDLRRHVKLVHTPPTQVIIKQEEVPTIKKPKRVATSTVFDKVSKWMTIDN